jgi:hypothetical protein
MIGSRALDTHGQSSHATLSLFRPPVIRPPPPQQQPQAAAAVASASQSPLPSTPPLRASAAVTAPVQPDLAGPWVRGAKHGNVPGKRSGYLQSPSSDATQQRLRRAAFEGDLPTIAALVTSSKLANTVYDEYSGATILFVAAQEGHHAVVSHLLAQGALPGAAARLTGSTPLHSAAANDHEEVVQALLHASHAELHCRNHVGNQPLHLAVANGCVGVVRCLVEPAVGVDLESRGAQRKPPIFLAMDAKHAPILELLADAIVRRFHYASTFVLRQAWVDTASGDGWAALEMARARGAGWEEHAALLRAAERTATVGAQQRLAWHAAGTALPTLTPQEVEIVGRHMYSCVPCARVRVSVRASANLC